MSLVSLAVLSYDRYSTLTVYNKRAPDFRKPLLAVAGAWLYSLFWTVPPLLGWSSYGLEGAGTSCSVINLLISLFVRLDRKSVV